MKGSHRYFSVAWAVLVVGGFLLGLCPVKSIAAQAGKYNVLFIVVDDLRPELGCYGAPLVKTPNVDALAQAGVVFKHAYCQQALCCASRTSLLTGCRPDTTHVFDNKTHFRVALPDVVTLPQYFREHGYHTQSLGKIYHDFLDDPRSWSVHSWAPQDQMYGKPENQAAVKKTEENLRARGTVIQEDEVKRDAKTGAVLLLDHKEGPKVLGPAWEDPDVPDTALRDGKLADKAVETLEELKDKPFFLAVGFYRPHLPFVAPKRYYDLYRPQDIRLADNPFFPKDVPPIAMEDSIELRSMYAGIPKKGIPIPDDTALHLIHGYYACVSYVDVQIGRVLASLDRLGLRDRTVVVLLGDHGWHLGEHSIWGKSHNFEVTTRAPLILSAPGQTKRGLTTDTLVEFVDVYPTLVDLCGFSAPSGLEGVSMAPLLAGSDRPWKKAVFSQYPRQAGKVMGYSMRTDQYRYTEWKKLEDHSLMGVELYDERHDPKENVNLAGQANRRALVAELSQELHAGWRAALPAGEKR